MKTREAIAVKDVTPEEVDLVADTIVNLIFTDGGKNAENKIKSGERLPATQMTAWIRAAVGKMTDERNLVRITIPEYDDPRLIEALQTRIARRVYGKIRHDDPDITWFKGKRV